MERTTAAPMAKKSGNNSIEAE
uniref:Uncharacterized protein n=1 Tax=Nelumbo nucifera TaxID=4432 RepID=A0A822ZVX2_NELNU|nr:TPA_asm: hypothetical protein HUJ06_016983 [Nelumbo nucifera]